MCKVSSTVHFVTRSAGGREGSAKAHWVPNTDVYTTDSGLVIKVELAGMRSDHLEITVEGSRLRISGTRPDGCRSRGPETRDHCVSIPIFGLRALTAGAARAHTVSSRMARRTVIYRLSGLRATQELPIARARSGY